MNIRPEELAAFADGELTGDDATRVAAAVAADPELQRQVEAHRALKARLAAHYAPLAERAVPDRLAALLQGGAAEAPAEIVDLAAAREERLAKRRLPRWSYFAAPALAASLALAVFLPGTGDTPEGYADTRLAAALETQLVAEQEQGAETRILLSFRNQEDALCRAFSGAGGGGIACRDAEGWQLEALGEGSAGQTSTYRQAGASDAEILALAQDMAAGPALDADQERAARRSSWR